MSFELQLVRKRQSCQATKSRPFLSISADGNGGVRRPPATLWSEIAVMSTGAVQVEPPFVEVKYMTAPSFALSIGTMTVPFGFTSGWPPIPVALFAVFDAPQVWPPSVDVFISIRLPRPLSSHSV